MSDTAEIEVKFWKAVRSDRTMMLALPGVEAGHSQPMTAQLDTDRHHGPIWFFALKDSDFVRAVGASHRVVAHFASKGHDLFASIDGKLVADNDRAVIDRLWNPFIAAWYEGGKDDPKLQLLRFDATGGQAWLNEHKLLAGIKMLLGHDPKVDFRDKVAELDLT
jgi:general stress protein 26